MTTTNFTVGFDRAAYADRAGAEFGGPADFVRRVDRSARSGVESAHRPHPKPVPLCRPGAAAVRTAYVARGFEILRRQINGSEYSSQRGVITFATDFGRDAMTNFRLGTASRYSVGIGDPHRGFRNWDMGFYAGDDWPCRTQAGAELRPALPAGDHSDGGERPQHHPLWLPVRQRRAALRLRLPAGRPLGRAARRLWHALRRDLPGHLSAAALQSARRDQARDSQSGSARSAGGRRYPAGRAQHDFRASART